MEVCNLQVSMNNLATGVEQPQSLIVVFQAGGQGQLHVCTPTDCKAKKQSGNLYDLSRTTTYSIWKQKKQTLFFNATFSFFNNE